MCSVCGGVYRQDTETQCHPIPHYEYIFPFPHYLVGDVKNTDVRTLAFTTCCGRLRLTGEKVEKWQLVVLLTCLSFLGLNSHFDSFFPSFLLLLIKFRVPGK